MSSFDRENLPHKLDAQQPVSSAAASGFMAADEFFKRELEKENVLPNRAGPEVDKEPHAQGQERNSIGRRSLNGLGEDLQKLRSEFSSLQEQLHQLPRRETLDRSHKTSIPGSVGAPHAPSHNPHSTSGAGTAATNIPPTRSTRAPVPDRPPGTGNPSALAAPPSHLPSTRPPSQPHRPALQDSTPSQIFQHQHSTHAPNPEATTSHPLGTDTDRRMSLIRPPSGAVPLARPKSELNLMLGANEAEQYEGAPLNKPPPAPAHMRKAPVSESVTAPNPSASRLSLRQHSLAAPGKEPSSEQGSEDASDRRLSMIRSATGAAADSTGANSAAGSKGNTATPKGNSSHSHAAAPMHSALRQHQPKPNPGQEGTPMQLSSDLDSDRRMSLGGHDSDKRASLMKSNAAYTASKAEGTSSHASGPPPVPPQPASHPPVPAALPRGGSAKGALPTIPEAPGGRGLYDAMLDSQRALQNSASGLGECLLGSSSDSLFQFPAAVPGSKAWKAANEVFEDVELEKLCDDGLHKRLQRTRDGATEASRIQELAGLVKLLRKCVRELGTRASMYVEQCMRIEKDIVNQVGPCIRGDYASLVIPEVPEYTLTEEVETVQLSSETAIKALEAELAGAKKDLAQVESGLKMDKATWGADLEMQKVEVSRLKRELERMSEERDRAREEGQRAEGTRQHLEAELKELRKVSSQQIREVSVTQGEAVRNMMEEKTAVEKREAALKEEGQRLGQRVEAANSCIEALQQELALMQQVTLCISCIGGSAAAEAGSDAASGRVHASLKDQVYVTTASEESLTQQLTQVNTDMASSQEQLRDAQALIHELQTSLSQQHTESSRLRTANTGQANELAQLKDRVADLVSELKSGRAAWEEERTQFVETRAKATKEATAIGEEKQAIQTALDSAVSQKVEVETALQELKKVHAHLEKDTINLKHQVEFAEGCKVEAEQQLSAVQTKLDASAESLELTQKELGVKGERLALLEGEFESLKEVIGDCGGQKDVVARLLTRISTLQGAVSSAEATRRRLHNELVELRGNIRVYCRVKPHALAAARCLPDQGELGVNIRVPCRVKSHTLAAARCLPGQMWQYIKHQGSRWRVGVALSVDGKEHAFSYDRVFGSNSSQEELLFSVGVALSVDGKEHAFSYDRVFSGNSSQDEVFSSVSELVQSALDGYHVCLFSYGQTGAGKTHTMSGSGDQEGRGVIPRAVEKILETASKLEEQEWEYTMEASFLEIYNNMLRDLLGGNRGYINDQNAIKHDPNGGHTTVVGVNKVKVTDAESAYELLRQASAARACESTAMNSTSSRSHSVFMLYITGHHPPSGESLQGCLCLVDLAGSERLDRSQVENQRKKEACAINQSLSALGDVFGALSSKSTHIPYRNSKLTYLLQPCLGGSGKTLMFVNINPEPASASESLCSLKFAAKVNGCETSAKGGARRNASGSASTAPTAQAGNGNRLSLPGPPRAAGGGAGASEQPPKRMSMTGQAARTGGPPVGSKRPGGSGIPIGGSKRVKPGQ
eukprot:gene13863-19786_t